MRRRAPSGRARIGRRYGAQLQPQVVHDHENGVLRRIAFSREHLVEVLARQSGVARNLRPSRAMSPSAFGDRPDPMLIG